MWGAVVTRDQVVVFSGADWHPPAHPAGPRPQPEANFGAALAGVGHVNGDGVPDLAVSAPGQDVRGLVDEGQVLSSPCPPPPDT